MSPTMPYPFYKSSDSVYSRFSSPRCEDELLDDCAPSCNPKEDSTERLKHSLALGRDRHNLLHVCCCFSAGLLLQVSSQEYQRPSTASCHLSTRPRTSSLTPRAPRILSIILQHTPCFARTLGQRRARWGWQHVDRWSAGVGRA